MSINGTETDYAVKPNSYYEQARAEMLPFVPDSCHRALDVGCGDGSFGALLRHSRNIEVWGVEPFESAAIQAANKLDRVINDSFVNHLELPGNAFDCIFFNDVLEHLVAPLTALQKARKLLTRNGVIIASIPNIRHFPTIWRLLVHGEWKYRDCGTLDKTHMRFFTRSSIHEIFEAAGLAIDNIRGIHPYAGVPNTSSRVWKLYKFTNALCFGKFDDMKFERYAVVGRPHPTTVGQIA